MRKILIVPLVILLPAAILGGADTAKMSVEPWQIRGDLSEACTCNVPCSCNFHQGPSPHHYCWAIFSLDIQEGHYGKVKLDGLHVAGVHGKKATVLYIDDRATPEQAAALKSIALHSNRHYHGDTASGGSKTRTHIETAHIVQEVGDKGNRVLIADKGGFEADYIMGMDEKTPVVVENNTSWNIPRSIKGKTKRFHYKDLHGNKVDMTGTNSNQGKFDWNDQTGADF